jgi:rhamnogalacturonyl hydrolase YesR
VAPPLAIAARLDQERGWVYRDHAVYQLRTYIDTFLVKESGLAKTILLKDGLGKTYWTRASGWLLWAMTGTLRYLPVSDPAVPGFLADLRRLADGIVRVQDETGGFHVLLDDTSTPVESTGTAMFAMAFHEAVRSGWLPDSFAQPAGRAWEFVTRHIGPDGKIGKAYTGWAVPAENRQMQMDQVEMGWIPGFVLSAAAEMETRL